AGAGGVEGAEGALIFSDDVRGGFSGLDAAAQVVGAGEGVEEGFPFEPARVFPVDGGEERHGEAEGAQFVGRFDVDADPAAFLVFVDGVGGLAGDGARGVAHGFEATPGSIFGG